MLLNFTRFNGLSFFWKSYIFIVSLLIFVVALVEIILEPLAEAMLTGLYGDFLPRHEAVLWAVSILIPPLVCGNILAKILSGKLEKMGRAAKALARGNLEARLPVKGNDQDAFDVLARSFNEMAQALKTQQYYERRLLADISHELRSPLTRMTVALELLARKHTDQEGLALRMEQELSRMNEMLSLLLEQARDSLTASRQEIIELGKIITELAGDYAFQGESEKKKIKTRIAGSLRVYGNVLQLERMLSAILSNAVFYAPADSLILVQARLEGENIRVSVRDYGPGAPEEELEDIFRAFYRVDASRARAGGGVGLGLAIARETAVRHGGSIAARNAKPGLELTVTLPAYS